VNFIKNATGNDHSVVANATIKTSLELKYLYTPINWESIGTYLHIPVPCPLAER